MGLFAVDCGYSAASSLFIILILAIIAAPLKNRLPGKANIAFKAQLSEPSALARRLEVTFTKDSKAAGTKDGKAAGKK